MLTSLFMLTLIKYKTKTLVLRRAFDYSRGAEKGEKGKENGAKTIKRNWEGVGSKGKAAVLAPLRTYIWNWLRINCFKKPVVSHKSWETRSETMMESF